MYTCDEIEDMQMRVYKASENEKNAFIVYLEAHTNSQDSNSVLRAVNLAPNKGCEAFDMFDSEVCERFIDAFEKTFKNEDWVKSCEELSPENEQKDLDLSQDNVRRKRRGR